MDLTVVHSGDLSASQDGFVNKVVSCYKVGPFRIQKYSFSDIQSADVVIGMFDLSWLTIMYIFFRCKLQKKKFIWWGLDRGNSDLAFRVKLLVCKFSDSVIFYNDLAKANVEQITGPSPRYEVANNTFDVGVNLLISDIQNSDRKNLIFVGSFDYRKRLDLLVKGFSEYRDLLEDYQLVLIGDGDCFYSIKTLISKLRLEESVRLVGRVNDPAQLAAYYRDSLISVSYGQAGLAVLQSLGNGVPFVTTANAISGGEICNIRDGITGFLVNGGIDSFYEYIVMVTQDEDLASKLRVNALNYYKQNCTIDSMVGSFLKVID